ncbi:MAG TPA: DUF4126 family protein [Solirubrobacteraceae bacterium]|nr:DUF4126 family protein [Solirubrobacteraceae bacterium]
MHLLFDIFQGIGIGAAVGIRPFLPALAAGALAAGDVEIHFNGTTYSFLQSSWFLLVLVVGTVLLVMVDRSPFAEQVRVGAWAYVVIAISLLIGGVFFAGSLARGHYAVWPGWLGGVACAAIGIAASRPFLARLRTRLDQAAAAVGLPVISDGSALLIGLLSVVAPPVGIIALLGLLWLLVRGRQRGQQKYAGLRILR